MLELTDRQVAMLRAAVAKTWGAPYRGYTRLREGQELQSRGLVSLFVCGDGHCSRLYATQAGRDAMAAS